MLKQLSTAAKYFPLLLAISFASYTDPTGLFAGKSMEAVAKALSLPGNDCMDAGGQGPGTGGASFHPLPSRERAFAIPFPNKGEVDGSNEDSADHDADAGRRSPGRTTGKQRISRQQPRYGSPRQQRDAGTVRNAPPPQAETARSCSSRLGHRLRISHAPSHGDDQASKDGAPGKAGASASRRTSGQAGTSRSRRAPALKASDPGTIFDGRRANGGQSSSIANEPS